MSRRLMLPAEAGPSRGGTGDMQLHAPSLGLPPPWLQIPGFVHVPLAQGIMHQALVPQAGLETLAWTPAPELGAGDSARALRGCLCPLERPGCSCITEATSETPTAVLGS